MEEGYDMVREDLLIAAYDFGVRWKAMNDLAGVQC